MMDLDIGVVSEVEKKQKKKLLLDYLYDNLKNHNWWAYRYFFCELLAFLNIVGKNQQILTGGVLNTNFLKSGYKTQEFVIF